MLNLERQFIRQMMVNKCGINSFNVVRDFHKWKVSQQSGHSPVSDRRPWITFQAISLLGKKVKPGLNVFEYGGGGSTLYFLDKGANVITVEHDKTWFDDLSVIITQDGLKKHWTGINIPPEDGATNLLPHSDPKSYKSSSKNFEGKNFESYVQGIDQYSDESFDVILVDGRARPSCVKRSAPKVRKGGCLVLDNTERDYYLTAETLACLSDFRILLDKCGPSPYVDFFTKTHVWERIS